MPESIFERVSRRIGFSEQDAERVRALRADLGPISPAIVERFYTRLFEHPGARAVFTGGEAQLARQRMAFASWMDEVFEADYGPERLERRLNIGAVHVRVGLPLEYMLIGMELVWQEIERFARCASPPEINAKLQSLHKLLTVELTLMLSTYQESFAQRIQLDERVAVQERLKSVENLAQIGHLAATLAHEIKNPLAGISGAIEIIGDGMPYDSPHRPIVREILSQIQRLNATVKDLLLYSRPPVPTALRFNLNKVVKRVMALLQTEPALRGLDVKFQPASPFLPVEADEGQLEQVVMNLVINAAQACSPGGRIRVATAIADGRVRLEVRDTGHGMTPEVQQRAFDPFYTTKSKGTGLGLSICRKIVEAQRGSIFLESVVGDGTTVAVEFPAAAESAPDDGEGL